VTAARPCRRGRGVLWLSASRFVAGCRGGGTGVVVCFHASIAQKHMERRWVKSLWVKWKSII
jgi:hypothetical protein